MANPTNNSLFFKVVANGNPLGQYPPSLLNMWILYFTLHLFWKALYYFGFATPPITLPPPKQLPTTPFDNLFGAYAQQQGRETIKKHRKRGNQQCSFIHRKVEVDVPSTVSDYNSLIDETKTRNALLFFRKGFRPYLLHVPHGVALNCLDNSTISYLQ